MTGSFDLRRLLEVLLEHDVRFVVIGGVAVVAHGAPVATFDLDVCYQREPGNLSRLAEALRALEARLRGAPADVPFQLDPRTLAAGDHFTFTTTGGDFDIMANPAGSEGFEQLLANATKMDLEGVEVYVASVDDLIRMKRASNRTKDQYALEHLGALRDEIEGQPE